MVVFIVIGAVLLLLVITLLCALRCGALDDELVERKLRERK